MYKEATYKKKFEDLHDWFPYLVETVKKDLRNEHLKKDPYFIKKFFSSKNIHRLTLAELVEAYQQAIKEEEQGEQLAEFISTRWLLKHSDIYGFFEQKLSAIHPDFSDMNELSLEDAKALIDMAEQEFALSDIYLFSVLNSVVFPESCFHELKARANKHRETTQKEIRTQEEEYELRKKQLDFETELSRVNERWEKKFQGLQKKYLIEVEALKKQIAALQRRLHEKSI